MPRANPYTGAFKQKVVEDVRENKLSYSEAMAKFGVAGKMAIQHWERIYLEEGPEGLYIERRGRASAANGIITKTSFPLCLTQAVIHTSHYVYLNPSINRNTLILNVFCIPQNHTHLFEIQNGYPQLSHSAPSPSGNTTFNINNPSSASKEQ